MVRCRHRRGWRRWRRAWRGSARGRWRRYRPIRGDADVGVDRGLPVCVDGTGGAARAAARSRGTGPVSGSTTSVIGSPARSSARPAATASPSTPGPTRIVRPLTVPGARHSQRRCVNCGGAEIAKSSRRAYGGCGCRRRCPTPDRPRRRRRVRAAEVALRWRPATARPAPRERSRRAAAARERGRPACQPCPPPVSARPGNGAACTISTRQPRPAAAVAGFGWTKKTVLPASRDAAPHRSPAGPGPASPRRPLGRRGPDRRCAPARRARRCSRSGAPPARRPRAVPGAAPRRPIALAGRQQHFTDLVGAVDLFAMDLAEAEAAPGRDVGLELARRDGDGDVIEARASRAGWRDRATPSSGIDGSPVSLAAGRRPPAAAAPSGAAMSGRRWLGHNRARGRCRGRRRTRMTQGMQPAGRWMARAAGLAACAAAAMVVMEARGMGQTTQEAAKPTGSPSADRPADVRFMTLDPGHFHAALVQKEMYPGVAPRVRRLRAARAGSARAPGRIAAFNTRAEHADRLATSRSTPAPDYFERMLREQPGNVVVLSGRNRGKIDRIAASVDGRPERARPTSRGSSSRPTCRSSKRRSRRRTPRARRLRHHDRALRDHVDPAARAGQRSGRRSASIVPGTPARARRVHGERAPSDEDGRGRAEHPAGLVLRHRASRARA